MEAIDRVRVRACLGSLLRCRQLILVHDFRSPRPSIRSKQLINSRKSALHSTIHQHIIPLHRLYHPELTSPRNPIRVYCTPFP